jgi:hypothetical protein
VGSAPLTFNDLLDLEKFEVVQDDPIVHVSFIGDSFGIHGTFL